MVDHASGEGDALLKKRLTCGRVVREDRGLSAAGLSLDLAGVCCSTGSACSSGSLLLSPVLRAMGVSAEVLTSAMRFSLGPQTTLDEVNQAAQRICTCVKKLRHADADDSGP